MALIDHLPPTATRVERNTHPAVNAALRRHTDAGLTAMENAAPAQFEARLRQLDREWDVERLLQLNASALVLLGLALGHRVDRRYLWLPAAVLSFFAQHALQGWCPPVPLFRRLGVRTVREIERERHALKAMRGDFDGLPPRGTAERSARVRAVMKAIDA